MKGDVLVISGLSGAGKSTLALELSKYLESSGRTVSIHDGDSLREFFDGTLQYSAADRLMVSKILVYAANVLSQQGIDVILSTMLSQSGARTFLQEHISFTEIHLVADFEQVSGNDVKGVYKDMNACPNPEIVGHDLEFTTPLEPDLLLTTDKESVEESMNKMLAFLRSRKLFGLGESE